MEQRLSLVTLGVGDVERARDFYGRLGWQGQTTAGTVFFQTGGIAVVLWGLDELTEDAGVAAPADGFGGVALAHNVRARDEVDTLVATVRSAGGTVTVEPHETFYGGYAAYFTDLDGHVWEVAHNPGFTIEPDGSLTLPDFGSA
jgi:predicted lactoylglutathione lyase